MDSPARDAWVRWFADYGPGKFYDYFVQNVQDCQSRCLHCGQPIYLDIVEGGGVPDWRTHDGDYGCGASPDTTDDGAGSHVPRRLRKEANDVG